MGMILKGDIFFNVVALNFFLLPLKFSCRNEVLEPAEKSITWEKSALQT